MAQSELDEGKEDEKKMPRKSSSRQKLLQNKKKKKNLTRSNDEEVGIWCLPEVVRDLVKVRTMTTPLMLLPMMAMAKTTITTRQAF